MRISRHLPLRRWVLLVVGALAGPMLLAPSAAAQSSDTVCPDVLVAISPDTIEGDETAVAITSQQLDADIDGWTQVSWQAADTTTLTAVTIHTDDGTTTRTNDLATGTAQNTLRLTFCGTTDTSGDNGTDGNGSGDNTDEPDDGPDTGSTDDNGSGEVDPQAPTADGDQDTAAAAQASDAVCPDVLVAISPDTIEGDETAVAITSQQLDADIDGWTQVSWQAADTTTLTAVTIHTDDGTTTRTNDLTTGTAQNTLRLTFCGTTDTPGDNDTDGNGSGEVTEVPDPTGESSDGTTSDDATPGSSGADSGSDATPETSDEVATDVDEPSDTADTGDVDDVEPDGSSESDVDAAGGDDSASGDSAGDVETAGDADEDTEVLGVQLSQEDDGAGWILPVLLLIAAAAAVAVGVVVRNRRLTQAGDR